MSVIYEIVNLATNERYIGSTKQFRRRMVLHKYGLKKGNHHSWKLQKAYTHVGWEGLAIRVLEECSSDQDLREREQVYLDTLKPELNVSTTAAVPTVSLASRQRQGQKIKDQARQINGFPVSYWAEKFGLVATTLASRLAKGWSWERATSTPPASQHSVGKMLTYQGETLKLTAMARKHGWSPATLCRRLKEGMSVEDALTMPPRPKHRKVCARE